MRHIVMGSGHRSMTLRKLLAEGFILDGAMGTQLIERGLKVGETSAAWNLERPDDVFAVHEAYRLAGAQAITTNTFAANRPMLARHGLESKFAEINRAAVSIAKRTGLPVFGDIGPSGDFLEPMGDLTVDELDRIVSEQSEILANAGVDGFLLETFSDPAEVRVTVETLRKHGLPVLATFTYERSGAGFHTMMGTTLAEAVAATQDADAVGANCGTSLSLVDYLMLADELLAAANGKPVLLQPNAGTPEQTENGHYYGVTPNDFAAFATAARVKGVSILGGCCGTTPAHIQAINSNQQRFVSD